MCKKSHGMKTVPYIVYEATIWKIEKQVKAWRAAAGALAVITVAVIGATVKRRG